MILIHFENLTPCAFFHRQETIKQAGIEKYITDTLERVQADMYNRYMNQRLVISMK